MLPLLDGESSHIAERLVARMHEMFSLRGAQEAALLEVLHLFELEVEQLPPEHL